MNVTQKNERTARVMRMNRTLRRLYPKAHIALHYTTPWELLVAVQLSAQCTDERVNKVTATLFKKYPRLEDYVHAQQSVFERDIFSCGFYRNKARNIIGAARMLQERFGGVIPHTMEDLLQLPGVARKTANVVLSNLYQTSAGIAVDTHVRRFAIRFDLSDFKDPVRIEKDLMSIMPQKDWWQFNHRLVHYGRDICPARKHDCVGHPLTKIYPASNQCWPRAH